MRPTAGWAAEVSSTSMASDVELVKRKADGVNGRISLKNQDKKSPDINMVLMYQSPCALL